eukprot:1763312-Karenia_brevis.AAC.1
MHHQVEVHRGKLICHRCGQSWADKGHYIGDAKFPSPEIWGNPQRNRPWLVPPGQNIQLGAHKILNTGPQGHKLQWFKGVLYCTQCGGWTAQSGQPKKLVAP